MSLVFLTARKIGAQGQDNQLLTTPEVHPIPASAIQYTKYGGTAGGSVVKTTIGGRGATRELWVAESPQQVEVAIDPASTNINAQDKATGVAATGSAQGAGYNVLTYLVEVTTATGGSADALDLPAALAGAVHVIVNNTAVPLELYPASGESIDLLAVNANTTVPARDRVHVFCDVDGHWQVCTK